MLKKMRADSHWSGLTFEQCETVEQWLFEDNLTHEATAARVKQEFGVEASRWSVGRFYRHRARVRQGLELLEAQVTSDELGAVPVRTKELRETAMKLLAKSALRLATERPADLKDLAFLTRLLLLGEENEIRLRRVQLGERYFDFEANTACAKDLEKARSYIQAVGNNESLTDAEKQQRVVELLFGRKEVDVAEAMEAESAEASYGLTGDQETAVIAPGADKPQERSE
jgi:hypothetical protein